MKEICYIKGSPFGEFFYDPLSREGVAVRGKFSSPAVLVMSEKYNPFGDPDAKTIQVEPEVFGELLDAGRKRSRPDAIRLAAYLRVKATG